MLITPCLLHTICLIQHGVAFSSLYATLAESSHGSELMDSDTFLICSVKSWVDSDKVNNCRHGGHFHKKTSGKCWTASSVSCIVWMEDVLVSQVKKNVLNQTQLPVKYVAMMHFQEHTNRYKVYTSFLRILAIFFIFFFLTHMCNVYLI